MLRPIFILLFGFLCSVATLAMDEKYAEALSLRDNKVAELSEQESSARAEQLFWELGKAGHSKAMHNYAMLQMNKENYDLAYAWFIKAGLDASLKKAEKLLKQGKVKQEINLIVGSTREAMIQQGRLIDALRGLESADLSHRNTFGGTATTMDVLPSVENCKAHIQGDAETYNLSSYVINAAFLEQLPTIKDNGVLNVSVVHEHTVHQVMNDLKYNFIGSCIDNIAKSMRPHAIMEIEWLPYTGLYGWSRAEFEECIRANPFHCFFEMRTALQAVFILGGDRQHIDMLPPEIRDATLEMVERIRLLLEFYHTQGVGESVDELISTLYWEAYVVFQMTLNKNHVILNYHTGDQDGKKLRAALQKALWGTFPAHVIGRRVKAGEHEQGIAYDRPTFLNGSFFNFLIQDLAAEYNKAHVQQYLESLDFEDVSIERTNNPHNGRKNVWMIRMRKRG